MSATKTPVEVEGKALTLSNLDKVLYPAVALTKRDVLRYYTAIGPVLLPHLAGRPVTFKRAPDGMAGGAFFEKHVPRGAPGWLKTITVPAKDVEGSKGNGEIVFPAISDLASLVWAANLAALELHVPMWRIGPKGTPRRPDLLVFDLDPGAPTSPSAARWRSSSERTSSATASSRSPRPAARKASSSTPASRSGAGPARRATTPTTWPGGSRAPTPPS